MRIEINDIFNVYDVLYIVEAKIFLQSHDKSC